LPDSLGRRHQDSNSSDPISPKGLTAPPLFVFRGYVYKILFEPDDPLRQGQGLIPKYALCLQEGAITNNKQFTGVLLTTCKDNNEPRLFKWNVYVSPNESGTKFGAIINCSKIYTFTFADIMERDTAYRLLSETMDKVDERIMFGVGLLKLEDLKRQFAETNQLQQDPPTR
jgi:hypothetical protein